ncbi:MAG: 16S rRNA (cytosine(967)-C(5))-methyltransferase RsmB [Rhodocyclaceae bacterium]
MHTSRRHPASSPRPRIAKDSLAHAFTEAAAIIAAVQEGRNATDVFEHALHTAHPPWSDAMRGAIRDLAWSALRDHAHAQHLLGQLLHKPLPEQVEGILSLAMLRMNARPEEHHTTVNQAVDAVAALAPGLRGVANGVLRNYLRRQDELERLADAHEPARYRHPQWWIDRVRQQYPDAWASILAAGNEKPPMTLRVNRRRSDVQTVSAALTQASIPHTVLDDCAIRLDSPVPVTRLPGFDNGLISVQDYGAQFAARLLDVQPGQRVLDACAAPGGKTAHLLESADVQLTALEIDAQRAERVRENLQRLGLQAELLIGDAGRPRKWWNGEPFERILADVPCSASGVLRRHPDIKWLRRPEDIDSFARQQAHLLEQLWRTLAPGGKLLYATCSIFAEENSMQIQRFCRAHPDAQRLPIHDKDELQLLPDTQHDGFYYALLQKHPA